MSAESLVLTKSLTFDSSVYCQQKFSIAHCLYIDRMVFGQTSESDGWQASVDRNAVKKMAMQILQAMNVIF